VIDFRQTVVFLIAIWLLAVAVHFRRSIPVLLSGLIAIGVVTLGGVAYRQLTLADLGLGIPDSWLPTVGIAVVWLVAMLAYSPLADWLATRWVAQPPQLHAFRAIQESRIKLAAGIMVAWLLGGFLEELIFRGMVVQVVEVWLTARFAQPIAAGVAICVAALGAGLIHFYQGPRAVVIITQLSVLFGILFVISGHNLWAVMLCHGLYDTVAFIRFARKKSKYSKPDKE
jgi:hypothetical protein